MDIHIFGFCATNFFRNQLFLEFISKEIGRAEHEYMNITPLQSTLLLRSDEEGINSNEKRQVREGGNTSTHVWKERRRLARFDAIKFHFFLIYKLYTFHLEMRNQILDSYHQL